MINLLFRGTIIQPIIVCIKLVVLIMQCYCLWNQIKYIKRCDYEKSEEYADKSLILCCVCIIL